MTYDFATDIEERNPWTGNVYYISRMTSDWAERHPLNVGDVIEGVYREFEGTEFEESREELRRVWTAVLSVSSPQGDASLYPNRGGRRRAAAMKVWLLAGDYWRRGFRTGDTLPAMVPGCRITRIDGDGRAIERYSLADRPGTVWIALFPKDMHLLEDAPAIEPEPIEVEASPESVPVIEPTGNQATETPSPCQASDTDNTVVADDESTAGFSPEVRGSQRGSEQGDDSDADRSATPAVVQTTPDPSYSGGEAAAQDIEAPEPLVVVTPRPTERERNAAARRRRREQREAQRLSYEARLEQEAREAEEYARQQERRKIFAAVGAAAVTLVMIYFFGLLGPAVFGLLAGGLLKG